LRWAVQRLPKKLKKIMQSEEWGGSIFVGGGYLRAIVAGEKVNDVDVFVKSQKEAELLAYKLAEDKRDVYRTDNAYTIKMRPVPVQIIHRWVFEKPEDVAQSFDFTNCCAVISCDVVKEEVEGKQSFKGSWKSYCDKRFYIDLASKRLIYRNPERNEDAGGSMLRVLKYYQKGYRIPLDSLADVIVRLLRPIDLDRIKNDEKQLSKVITGLLREVDPNIDPLHESHLPSMENTQV
jgi:hypothetical protein